jgi:transketolase
MRYDPSDPWHPTADRLVLSEGHAVPIIYAALADLGATVGRDKSSAFRLTPADVDQLRTRDSVLDGHPNPAEGVPFFDAATGSLGQGLSVAAGLALAARLDSSDRRIYVLIGDGESREGQIWEAADFVVDHGLKNVRPCSTRTASARQPRSAAAVGQRPVVSHQASAEDGRDRRTTRRRSQRSGTSAGGPALAIVAHTSGAGALTSCKGNWHKPLKPRRSKRRRAPTDRGALAQMASCPPRRRAPEPGRPGEPRRGGRPSSAMKPGLARPWPKARWYATGVWARADRRRPHPQVVALDGV